MDNSKHPSLNRIINQINENKNELVKPENLMESVIESSVNEAPPKPVEDVREYFTEEELQKRELELQAEEAELDNEELFAGRPKPAPGPENEAATPVDSKDLERYDAFAEQAGQALPPEVQEFLSSEKEEYSFHSVYDLRDFFRQNKDQFEEWAHPAIESILTAVGTITSGCKCKLDQRKKMVEDYYVEFIRQNQHTSLVSKMMEILKTKKLKFYSREKLFIEFPIPEE